MHLIAQEPWLGWGWGGLDYAHFITLEKIRGSWLFREQVRFAELTLTPLTADNAGQFNAMAHELLHYSPEAPVVEKLIESAILLGRDEEARLFLERYRAAYPAAYARWSKLSPCWVAESRSDGQDQFAYLAATKLPDLPPCFSINLTPVMVMPRSTALHMS